MCDFSWSEGGATLDKVPPHIRDALERAAALEPAEVSGPRNEEAESLRAEVARLREKCRSLEKREAALEAQVADRESEIIELREYARDAQRLQDREHAYLRATHLDPAIGLELELLKEQVARHKDDEHPELERKNAQLLARNDELAAAAAAAEAERNHLRLRLQEFREELQAAREWNDQLEEEREELYGMLDNANKPVEEPPPAKTEANGHSDDAPPDVGDDADMS